MERWAKSVNAAKTQMDDTKKGTPPKPEEAKPAESDVFKVVRLTISWVASAIHLQLHVISQPDLPHVII